jgi:hypothetical protein
MLDEPLRMTELCGGQFQFATERHSAFPAANRVNLSRSIGIYRHQAIFLTVDLTVKMKQSNVKIYIFMDLGVLETIEWE